MRAGEQGGALDGATIVTAGRGGGWFSAERFIPSDERAVLILKPHPAFLLLASPRRLVALALVVVLAEVFSGVLGAWARPIAGGAGVFIGLQIIANSLQYATRWYVLTDKRVMRIGGVLAQVGLELPLRRIELFAVARPPAERLLGLGRVGFASGATGGVEVVWATIARPREVLDRVRPMVERAARGQPGGAAP
ncbi:MAG: PH domain-containing protein [Planctomycetota bacterium]